MLTRLFFTCMLLFACTTLLQAQSKGGTQVLIKFDNGQTVTKDEFEYVYQKNNGGYTAAGKHDPKLYRDYLDLYTKFKRKVMDAQSKGMDTTRAFKEELNGYIKQLAQPYLIEKEVLNGLIDEAHQRSHQAIKVSHILIGLPQNPTPADTLAKYNEAMKLRQQLVGGADFATLARAHSADPSAKTNGGYLSWFTVFDFIYPFENAAYSTPVGGISMPVRTEYGYHLIKVLEKKNTNGLRTASHILVRWGKIYTAKDSLAALARVQEAYQKLRTGAKWEDIVKEYSDDPNSKTRNGDLGDRYIGVQVLQDKKFELQPGTISQPFSSEYGFHILKVDEPATPTTLETTRAEFKSRVTRDKRSEIAESELVTRLKKQYAYQANAATLKLLKDTVGTAYLQRTYTGENIPAALRKKLVMSFKGGQATVDDLIANIQKNRRRDVSRLTIEQALNQEVDELAKQQLLAFEEKQLGNKYPEFRHLTREYRDGILLFSLTEDKVWRKAVEDSAGLSKFYELNKTKYQAGARARMVEYRSPDSLSLYELRSYLQETGNTDSAKAWIERKGHQIRPTDMIFEYSSANGAAFQEKPVGYTNEPEKEGNQWTMFYLKENLGPGIKSLDEARSETITDYQTYLENQWNQELATRYPAKVNEKVFQALFK